MIDSVRAARSVEAAHTGTRWLIVGHSQGGHGALVTMDRADELPDMELLGTVALAPGAEFTETFGDDVQLRIITTMVLMGGRDEWPDVDPADYLSSRRPRSGRDHRDGLRRRGDRHHVSTGDLARLLRAGAGPTARPCVHGENDPTPEAVDVPLLLVTGTADIIVVPDRVRSLRDRLCGLGQELGTWSSQAATTAPADRRRPKIEVARRPPRRQEAVDSCVDG